jgi:hypothetical protein
MTEKSIWVASFIAENNKTNVKTYILGITCVQSIWMKDKHVHILLARKESQILRNTIWILAKQGLHNLANGNN